MRSCLAIVLTALCLNGAEGGASISPAPGFEPPHSGPSPQRPVQPQQSVASRPTVAFEVEVLTVKTGDVSGLSQWVELAAIGYHVVAAVPGDGQIVVFLERSLVGAASGMLRLPAGIDAETAAKLKVRIEAAQVERQRATAPPRPPQTMVEERK